MTSSSKTLHAVMLVLRIALGAIFVYAAWTKLVHVQLRPFFIELAPWQLFAMEVNGYQLLPLKAVELVARTLPWFELLLGLLLIAGYWLRSAAAATALLLAGFFTLMVRAYARGLEIPCGCFGANDIISWKTLLRDGSLLAAALALVVLSILQRRESRSQE
ncbi:MAG TPA: MauE/DoxX family redox-associated membrane protein [Bryobacteraceae bacterium]